MQQSFGLRDVFGKDGKPFPLDENNFSYFINKKLAKEPFSSCGINFDLFSIPGRDPKVSCYEFHTGTQKGEKFIDFYNIDIGDQNIPDLSTIKKSIELFNPFEAYLTSTANELQLQTFKRQNNAPGFLKPVIIRWLHYLDSSMIKNVGGLDHCLIAPAWRVEKFHNGVIIQLLEEPIDMENYDHCQAQLKVMTHFGLQ